ncbi:MAG: glycoside hydrolase [Ignavibacteriae bacterium HGW-Ignavibacteriae-3]|nr:MAG: glycoside hydrolase [Ignavibacteriae bacterium HGW-Ignavibacteriae-3]
MRSYSILFILIYVLLNNNSANAQRWERIVNLKGVWKFSIGDDENWSKPKLDDRDWETVKAPSAWEEEGFHGYNGYAWYRKHFLLREDLKGKNLILCLGRIDDVDQVFINGNLIGASGTFPPRYKTAYNVWREYPVPDRFLNSSGENIVAVRIYDAELSGGLIEGDLGLFEQVDAMHLDMNLAGQWKFALGDDPNFKNQKFADSSWNKLFVPGSWDSQGYSDYDGFAWYRFTFTLPGDLADKKLVLVLGKIDDIDEAYLNGKLIGSTGIMDGDPIDYDKKGEYQLSRGYYIPSGLMQPDKDNVIAVRVYDGFRIGGIYQGPVGLIEQSKYTKFWRNYKPPRMKKSFWDLFFE